MSAGVVIAGAGLAAQRCCETLRAHGYEGAIRIVGEEPHAPYDRPPLSKDVLAGRTAPFAIALRPAGWHAANGVELILGRRAVGLDPDRRRLRLDGGDELAYEHLVLATGGTARTLPGLPPFANAFSLRTLDDALALRATLTPGARVVIVGAGFIGLEVAATARRLGAEVALVEAAEAPLAGVLGPALGAWFASLHWAEGVEVLTGAGVEAVRGGERAEEVVLAGARRLPCDALVVGVGMAPATAWLAGSGLEPDGVRTSASGRTRLPDVYAAGDAARPWDPATRRHRRAEHWEAAVAQAGAVARAILGLPAKPASVPVFWSDQYGVRIHFAGSAEGHDHVQVDGDPAARDFRAVLLRRGRPIGGLLVGRPRALPDLRRLVAAGVAPPPVERKAA